MINLITNIPELDRENLALFQASKLLEEIGNEPNPTANEFYRQLLISETPLEDHEEVTLAAISIETMMNLDIIDDDLEEPTVH